INFRFMTMVLSFILCFAAIGFGQRTTGNIEGTITDQNGAVVPGASVTAKSTGTTAGYNSTVTTNENGYFMFSQVPVGTFTITATGKGFKTSSGDITVVLDKNANFSPKLEVGAETTTVLVTSDSEVTIDQSSSKIDTNITKQIIDDLPSGTNFSSLLKIAPNVRPEPLAAGFQIDGASGAENVFVIDGQEVTNFRTGQLGVNNDVPFELVQEVQIKSTGFEAEYGGATGGVINVVTGGGNDAWRGNFGVSFSPSKFSGSPRPVLLRYGNLNGQNEYFTSPKGRGTNFFPVANISGPVIKEKLWFSAVYSPQLQEFIQDVNFYSGTTRDLFGRLLPSNNPNTRTISSTQQFRLNRKIEDAFIRVDAQPTSRIRMFGTFLYNPIIDKGATAAGTFGLSNFATAGPFAGGLIPQSEFFNNQGGRTNSNSVNGQITYNPTNNVILNVRAGRSFLNQKLASYGIPNETQFACNASGDPTAIPGGAAAAGCSAGFTNFSNNFQNEFDVSTRTTIDTDASFVGLNFAGRHNFKVGYQYNALYNNVDQGYRDTGIVTLYYATPISSLLGGTTATPGNLGSGILTRLETVGEASSANQGVFAQDSWQIMKRLTLNLGFRAEKEKVPTFSDAGADINFGWGDKIAPRLGFALDLTGDGKTKVFGSYGWFYDRFKYELPRGSFGGDFFRRDYFEILPGRGAHYSNYTAQRIIGTTPDLPGGNCPTTAPGVPSPTIGNGYSICQFDFRIPSNLIGGSIFESGAVDPDLKAARQSEYTIGIERQLWNNFLLSARYTHKQMDHVIEDVGVFNSQGSEAYIIGNPGEGLTCEISEDANRPCTKAQRDYDAFEIRIDKRANNYFFNASYTLSRLFGNYSGLASSDEAGRSSPNVNRFFDLPFLGYTADGDAENGRLATDRPHVFKAYGGYSYNWDGTNTNRTTISAFTSIQSGTPLTTIYTLYAVNPTILNGRGDLGRTEMFTQTDLSINHRYKFGRDNRFTFEGFVDFINLLDEKNILGVQSQISNVDFRAGQLTLGGCTTCGDEAAVIDTIFNGSGIRNAILAYTAARPQTANGQLSTYGLPNSYQAPRSVRFGFRFFF
ncbi:MAG: TonB-dependent receptor, partial [Pyrinomonadaceae bacterium]